MDEWVKEQWEGVPDTCPHGYGPVKVDSIRIDHQSTSVTIPGTYACPDQCPESIHARLENR